MNAGATGGEPVVQRAGLLRLGHRPLFEEAEQVVRARHVVIPDGAGELGSQVVQRGGPGPGRGQPRVERLDAAGLARDLGYPGPDLVGVGPARYQRLP